MKNQEKNNGDLLRYYINPGQKEKAPEGFTSKVMNRIETESLHLKSTRSHVKINMIPLFTLGIIALLVLAALLIQGNPSDSASLQSLDLFNNIKLQIPKFDLSFIFRLYLPAQLKYIIASVFLLTLFDRVLNRFFHREKL